MFREKEFRGRMADQRQVERKGDIRLCDTTAETQFTESTEAKVYIKGEHSYEGGHNNHSCNNCKGIVKIVNVFESQAFAPQPQLVSQSHDEETRLASTSCVGFAGDSG